MSFHRPKKGLGAGDWPGWGRVMVIAMGILAFGVWVMVRGLY